MSDVEEATTQLTLGILGFLPEWEFCERYRQDIRGEFFYTSVIRRRDNPAKRLGFEMWHDRLCVFGQFLRQPGEERLVISDIVQLKLTLKKTPERMAKEIRSRLIARYEVAFEDWQWRLAEARLWRRWSRSIWN